MFVGHGVGSNALAAINIVAPLFLVCTGIGLMFGIGASVIGGIRLAEGNVKAAYHNDAGVAAYSVGCYLFPLMFSISNAVAQSSQPIISYNYGAGQPARVRQALKVSIIAACICGLAITFGMWTGAPALAGVFLDSAESAYALARQGLPLLGLCALFFALNITFIGYYQSCERAARSICYMLLRGVVFLVPGFFLLPRLLSTTGLWLAIPVSEILTLTVIAVIYLCQHRRRSLQPVE